MATYQFVIYSYDQMTSTGTAEGNSTVNANGTFTIASGSTPITLVVTDDDPIFHDGAVDTSVSPPDDGSGLTHGDDNNQVLAVGVTINGTFYPAGTKIELEFAMSTTAAATGATPHLVYWVRLGGTTDFNDTGSGTTPTNAGTNVGIAAPADDPLLLNTLYTIGSTATDLTNTTYEDIACFTHGTMIETADGTRVIEDLLEGDLVATLDHGSQAVRWIGSRHVSYIDMMANPALRPVVFEAGTIGNSRALTVSPQHRVLLSDWRAQVYFGEDQILVPAKALVNGSTIRQVMPAEGVTYCHLLFDQHEILVTEGALTESFHPSDDSLNMLTHDQQRELDMIFPELAVGTLARQTAYPVVRVQDAKSLRMSA
jgi:Hint domain